jgi:hypothetical protein
MKWIPAALSLILITSTTLPVNSQSATRKKYGRIAEVSLAGISLYSSGRTIIKKYGSPDIIEGISIGAAGGGGGGPAGNGGGGGRDGGRGGGGGNNAQTAQTDFTFPADGPLEGFIGDPFGQSGKIKQLAPGEDDSIGGGGGGPKANSTAPGGGGAPAPGGGGGGGSTTSTTTQYTRWVYKRPNARYAFVLDKYNKVIQMEAVGINDSNVKTSRGIKFGSTFAQLMERYYEPDGYDISGDGFIVRFLQRGKVAFRFSRLEAGKPHRVTGIVVAAGKS